MEYPDLDRRSPQAAPSALSFTLLVALWAALLVTGCANGGGPPTASRGAEAPGPDAATTEPPVGPADCGNLGNACCAGRCEGELMCLAGSCASPTCGALAEPCCATSPSCYSGLDCTADGCAMPAAAPCGGEGQACCSGTASCGFGLSCEGGACAATGAPSSPADAGAPPADSGAPPADSGAPPTPPTGDPCAGPTDCFSCTSGADCGFCDGRCVTSDLLGPPGCASYRWFQFECAL